MASETEAGVAWTVGKLIAVVVAMFAFVFVVMVPLYDVLCEALGINGKTSGQAYEVVEYAIDENRTIRVQFLVTHNDSMPWEFGPEMGSTSVHPGEARKVVYRARNPEKSDMVAQAIPSVTPSRAAPYFHKTECFCFERQPLEAGAEVDMPLQFIVDRDLPADITTITLSYTIFDITDMPQRRRTAAAR